MKKLAAKLRGSTFLNQGSAYGSRRLFVIGGSAITLLVVMGGVTLLGSNHRQLTSHAYKQPGFDPLPGGTHSDDAQETLMRHSSREHADAALADHRSYTPPMPASVAQPRKPTGDDSSAFPLATDPSKPFKPFRLDQAAERARLAQAKPITVPPTAVRQDPAIHKIAANNSVDQGDGQGNRQGNQQPDTSVNNLLRGWSGQRSNTEVTLTREDPSSTGTSQRVGVTGNAMSGTGNGGNAMSLNNEGSGNNNQSSQRSCHQIMPAGRGIYAHSITAADSDTQGPIIIEGDTGPFAGDRMIGSFTRAGAGAGGGSVSDRMIVRVNSIQHRDHQLTAEGLVVAPGTMETTVASSVDEHIAGRFLLPAAAAFVSGLGQAIATTSNTVGVLSPLGGASYETSLRLPQQIGVAAGSAAANIGSTLAAQAPKGSTVHIDQGANFMVMFLAPVCDDQSR